MERAPMLRAPLASDDEECPAFLCGVAAEAVNDAIQLINGLDSGAELPLRSALEILIKDATVAGEPNRTQRSRAHEKPRELALSAATIDHIVEERLRQVDETYARDQIDLVHRLRSPMGSADPDRYRAIMLILETVAILHQKSGDSGSVPYLQMALDGLVESLCPRTLGTLADQQKH